MADAMPRREVEALTTAYLPLRPELAPFRAVPNQLGKTQLFGFLTIVPFLVPFGIAFGIMKLVPEWSVGLKGFPIVVTAFALGTFLALRSVRVLARQLIESHRKLDVENLGAPEADEMYVGVAYKNGVWHYRNESAWDRGYLKVLPEGLHFRGYGPEFVLPSEAISSVRIGSFDMSGLPKCYRCMVDWTAPDGGQETVTFDPRKAAFGPNSLAEVEALAARIESLIGAPSRSADQDHLPFRSSSVDLTETIRSSDFNRLDFVVAGILSLPIVLIFGALWGLLSVWIPVLRTQALFVVMPVWMISYAWILSRRAKKRHLAAIGQSSSDLA